MSKPEPLRRKVVSLSHMKTAIITSLLAIILLSGCQTTGEKVRVDTRGSGSVSVEHGGVSYRQYGRYSEMEMGDRRSTSGAVSISTRGVQWENESFDLRF